MAVGLGFAGLGWLGESLIKELPTFPGLRLAAVQDVNAQLAKDVADRYGANWQGASFDSLLAQPDVEAVLICTPNFLHVPQAEAALRAGKHVLVQKPLALLPADAERIITQAADASRVLLVDCSYRFVPTMQALKEALTRAGRPRRVHATFHNVYGPGKPWFFDALQSGGGALTDLGIHLLDLTVDLLAPSYIRVARARFGYERGYKVEDSAWALLHADAVPVEIEVSWLANRPLTDISVVVDCDEGTFQWQNMQGSFFHFRTTHDGGCLLDCETTLRCDTLRAFAHALAAGRADPPDARTYQLLADIRTIAVAQQLQGLQT